MRGGWSNSGEAAAVGGDDLFGMISSGGKASAGSWAAAPMRGTLSGRRSRVG